jgi:drug/metabolite transporter (DMT)-like permease
VNRVATIWSSLSDERQRRRLIIGALAAVVAGVALIAGGQLAGADWTRIFGVILITVGGVGLGVILGAGPRVWETVAPRLAALRRPLVLVLAAVFGLPVTVALLAGLPGAFGSEGHAALTVAGSLILLAFVAATVVAVVIAIRAGLRADAGPYVEPTETEETHS